MTEYRFDPELSGAHDLAATTFDDVPAARARMAALLATPEAPADLNVVDFEIPTSHGTVAARRYRRADLAGAVLPGYVHIHGGGFALGDLAVAHPKCVELARALPVGVVQIDYRLAPEHPFPAGLTDCVEAWTWLTDHAPELGLAPEGLALGGDSAGGCLAVATSLLLAEDGGTRPAALMLCAPMLDSRLGSRSMRAFTDTPLWSRRSTEQSWALYLSRGVEVNGRPRPDLAAPALSPTLASLPTTFVAACEYDPLRDEDIAFAQALMAEGVSVELRVAAGTYHGFWTDGTTRIARDWLRGQTEFLRRVLSLHG